MDRASLMDEGERRRRVAEIVERRRAASDEELEQMPIALVREHGALGYALFHRVYDEAPATEFHDLADAPEGCPWRGLDGAAPEAAIAAIFAPIAGEIPRFVAALQQVCRALVAMRRPPGERRPGWFLLYLLDRGAGRDPRCTAWLGGAPMRRPRLSQATRAAGWTLPPELLRLYAVHNGFGHDNGLVLGTSCLQSAKQLRVLRAGKGRLLEVYCDDVGNRKCYQRNGGGAAPRLVDWDHETGEIAAVGSLWRFIERDMRPDVLGVDPWTERDG